MDCIQVRDLCFGISQKKILRGLNFSVGEGEYISIIGPNGSGKTTLLRCMDKIYKVINGDIHICNTHIDKLKQKELAKLIGYVPQGTGENYPFTVYEYVMMGRYPYMTPFSPPKKEDEDAVHDALLLTGTDGFSERYLSTLSGGERQKVSIAAALAQGSKILLLDEPTTFLDPKHQEDIQRLLIKINRESGMTILAATHDINSAIAASDRIIALKDGTITFMGSPQELIEGDLLKGIYEKEFFLLNHPKTGMPMVF